MQPSNCDRQVKPSENIDFLTVHHENSCIYKSSKNVRLGIHLFDSAIIMSHASKAKETQQHFLTKVVTIYF